MVALCCDTVYLVTSLTRKPPVFILSLEDEDSSLFQKADNQTPDHTVAKTRKQQHKFSSPRKP